MATKAKKMMSTASGRDVGFDMTPMIDCVFLLIIFFMVSLAFEESQVEARLTLPAADMAKPPEAVEKDMFTFNVVNLLARAPSGALLFPGKPPYVVNGAYLTGDELLKQLKAEAELSRSESIDRKVERGVIIRGDKDAAWAYILAAMKLCQEAGFSKVYLKAVEKPLGEQVKEELKLESTGN